MTVDTAVSVAPPPTEVQIPADAPVARRPWLWLSLAAVGVGLAMYATGSLTTAGLANFRIIFGSLLLQAIPLVMMGAFVAALIGTFVPASAFARLSRLPEPLQIPAAGIAGFAFPVCECGSVPVARRLVARGLIPSAAVTFMLAAPILNPIVIVSTSIAYRGRDVFWPMVLGRTGLGFVAAMVVGWVIGGRAREGFLRQVASGDLSECGCQNEASACDCDHHDCGHHEHEPRWKTFCSYLAGDFAYMGRFLIFGAAVAAALQTLVPQSVLGSVASIPIVSLITMMALAFALSLCSESDAFVAASFVQFGVGPQLAFLVFGPMMDAKLAFLYNATFSKGFLRTVLAVVTVVTLVGTLWIEVLIG
ncbi:MAG: permease [Actinobacteria bacterium]|nr:permease [Actinomycetota bacterium]